MSKTDNEKHAAHIDEELTDFADRATALRDEALSFFNRLHATMGPHRSEAETAIDTLACDALSEYMEAMDVACEALGQADEDSLVAVSEDADGDAVTAGLYWTLTRTGGNEARCPECGSENAMLHTNEVPVTTARYAEKCRDCGHVVMCPIVVEFDTIEERDAWCAANPTSPYNHINS